MEKALNELFDGFGGKKVHTAVMAVRSGDGSFSWSRARGVREDGDKVMAGDPYFIASVTKTFAAVVTLLLEEQEALSLRAPIGEYLPDELLEGLHLRKGEDLTGTITVEHLLSNTSGLPNFYEDKGEHGVSLQQRLFRGEEAQFDVQDVVRVVREEMKPKFAPLSLSAQGKRGEYSDTNFQLLGEILERVTGKGLGDVLREQLIEPLGLGQTYLYGRGEAADGESKEPLGIFHKDRPMKLRGVMRCFGADGALVSTTTDQLRFMQALMAEEIFAKGKTLERMQGRWNKIWFPLEYGLGLMRVKRSRLVSPLSPPPTIVGHSGSSGSWLYYCRDLDLYLVGTVNQTARRGLPFRLLFRALQVLEKGL